MSAFRKNQLILIAQRIDSELGSFYQTLHRDDRIFLHEKLEHLPLSVQRIVLREYKTESDRVSANQELRKRVAEIERVIPVLLRNHFDADDKQLREFAKEQADIVRLKMFGNIRNVRTSYELVAKPVLGNFPEISETGLATDAGFSGIISGFPETDSELLGTDSRDFSGIPETNSEIHSEVLGTKSRNFPEIPELKSARNLPESHMFNGESGNAKVQASRSGTEFDQAVKQNYRYCIAYAKQLGVKPPKLSKRQTELGCIKRMQEASWWLKRLRQLQKRKTEQVMQILGKVNRSRGIYCSDTTVQNRRLELKHQYEFMSRSYVVNEDGQRFSLKEISDKNVSNPVLRRNELMTRLRGFEDLSKELGHIGSFVTITCPSKYHCAYAKSGERNPKWQGATPYDSQQYLCSVWAKIRAELARQGISIYGIRVAEPQHDGTPHWHMILFMAPEYKDRFNAVVMNYALEEDGSEAGAKENRVKLVDIDPNKGSATGYLAKYIAKNIDGAGLDQDINGGDPIIAAQRVEAWASCWGIRQFQQIGGVSVTVWREARRLKAGEQISEAVEAVREAADQGNWKQFTQLMG
jgi:hypothetical protein